MNRAVRSVAAVERARPVPRRNTGLIALPVLVLLIAAFGVLMVYSASFYVAETQYGDAFFFMRKQLVGFILGAAAMAAGSPVS